MKEVIKGICRPFLLFFGTLFCLSMFQWMIINLYNYYCIDNSFLGFIKNIATLGGPFCHSLNRIQLYLSEYFITYFGIGFISLTSWITNSLGI